MCSVSRDQFKQRLTEWSWRINPGSLCLILKVKNDEKYKENIESQTKREKKIHVINVGGQVS